MYDESFIPMVLGTWTILHFSWAGESLPIKVPPVLKTNTCPHDISATFSKSSLTLFLLLRSTGTYELCSVLSFGGGLVTFKANYAYVVSPLLVPALGPLEAWPDVGSVIKDHTWHYSGDHIWC